MRLAPQFRPAETVATRRLDVRGSSARVVPRETSRLVTRLRRAHSGESHVTGLQRTQTATRLRRIGSHGPLPSRREMYPRRDPGSGASPSASLRTRNDLGSRATPSILRRPPRSQTPARRSIPSLPHRTPCATTALSGTISRSRSICSNSRSNLVREHAGRLEQPAVRVRFPSRSRQPCHPRPSRRATLVRRAAPRAPETHGGTEHTPNSEAWQHATHQSGVAVRR